jgi:hypothetical protein
MQLLDSSSIQLLDALQDIVSNVRINSNFCISHPNYQPMELPAEVVARFQQLPTDIQNKYLSLRLRSFLYVIYYNGSYEASLADDANLVSVPLHQHLENNTMRGLNLEFYQGLHESNHGEGYFDPGWTVLRQESDGILAVKKNGLTLHIERKPDLQLGSQSPTVGDAIAILMPRNLLENGFYVAVGNAGLVNRPYPDGAFPTVDIYFNLSPEGAAPVMDSITQQLNEIKIPFTFKVLYNPSDYGRYDSGCLHFERSNYWAVRQVLQTVYAQKRCLRRASPTHFQKSIPLFAKLLALGLGLAEEPNCKFAASESFGMNRCQIIANGLLSAWLEGDDSKEARMTSIRQHFSRLGIDLQRPYLNANSEDIYTPLD